MARIVEIIPTKDTITCEEGNSCTFDFTVTNVFNRKLGVGAKLITEGETPEQWLKVEGGPAWDLDKTTTDKITVLAQIPQGVAAGKYKFHLCVFSLTNSDEDYTDSSSVMIDVKAKPVVEKEDRGGIPWWIPVSIVMVLLIGGGVAWWALSKPDEAPVTQKEKAPITQKEVVVLVPKVTGLPRGEAEDNLTSFGLKVTTEERTTEEAAPNIVLEQDPPGKEKVKEGTAVKIIVAVKPKVKVPDVLGDERGSAENKIIKYGLKVGKVTEMASEPPVPAGHVIDQTPKSTEQTDVLVEKGTEVALTVSAVPPPPQPGGVRFPLYHLNVETIRQFQLRGIEPEKPPKEP